MRRTREELGLDLTPLIDIIFVLLMFFMISSVFKHDEFALDLMLPQKSSVQVAPNKESLTIELSKNEIAFNGKVVSLEYLESQLLVLPQQTKEPIFIRADKSISYERLTQVLGLLQRYNHTNIALITN